ncbi:MAG: hypothetical protein ACM3ZE_27705 [Myxococcales bacterium]
MTAVGSLTRIGCEVPDHTLMPCGSVFCSTFARTNVSGKISAADCGRFVVRDSKQATKARAAALEPFGLYGAFLTGCGR